MSLIIESEFRKFILERKHPCLMANTVFALDNYYLKSYDNIGSKDCLRKLLKDLEIYIGQYDFHSNEFQTFLAVFPNNKLDNELQFEEQLWKSLINLHELDNHEWDPTVSENPEDSNFSFSLAGKAFYVIGLHPKSSRFARQSPYTTLVFNLHWQFERLREMGTYEKVKERIRKRDKDFQGSINPMLRNFGEDSEAKQYSGRMVDNQWKCPFHSKHELV